MVGGREGSDRECSVGGNAAQRAGEAGLEAVGSAEALESSVDEGAQAAVDGRAPLAVRAERQVLVKVVIPAIAESSIEEEVNNALHIVTEHSCFLPGA